MISINECVQSIKFTYRYKTVYLAYTPFFHDLDGILESTGNLKISTCEHVTAKVVLSTFNRFILVLGEVAGRVECGVKAKIDILPA